MFPDRVTPLSPHAPTMRPRRRAVRRAVVRAMRRAALVAAVVAVALVVGACGSGPAGPAESFDPGSPQITASGEKFDKAELDVPANQGFELVMVNRDAESHNVSIYSDPGHSQVVFHGELSGNGTKVYRVQALAPGTYYFQCDVHPAMKGTVVAAPAAPATPGAS